MRENLIERRKQGDHHKAAVTSCIEGKEKRLPVTPWGESGTRQIGLFPLFFEGEGGGRVLEGF